MFLTFTVSYSSEKENNQLLYKVYVDKLNYYSYLLRKLFTSSNFRLQI